MMTVQPAAGAKFRKNLASGHASCGPSGGTKAGGREPTQARQRGQVGYRREELRNLCSQLVALRTPPGYDGLHCLEHAPDDLDGTSGTGVLGNVS
jgi:hypothetical protein